MSSFEQLCRELSSISNSLNQHKGQLEKAKVKSQKASDFTQRFFSDQKPGQDIVKVLTEFNYELGIANSSLETLQAKINTYVSTIRR